MFLASAKDSISTNPSNNNLELLKSKRRATPSLLGLKAPSKSK